MERKRGVVGWVGLGVVVHARRMVGRGGALEWNDEGTERGRGREGDTTREENERGMVT